MIDDETHAPVTHPQPVAVRDARQGHHIPVATARRRIGHDLMYRRTDGGGTTRLDPKHCLRRITLPHQNDHEPMFGDTEQNRKLRFGV